MSIDLKINVGLWYSIRVPGQDAPILTPRPDLVDRLVSENKVYEQDTQRDLIKKNLQN